MSHPLAFLWGMKCDEKVNRLAERQYGVVATWQLRELGADRNLQRRRVDVGRWEVAGHHVIRLAGAPPTAEQGLLVSVLGGGPDSLASHESAAWLWQLPGFASTVHVIRPRHAYAGASNHRPRLLLPHH